MYKIYGGGYGERVKKSFSRTTLKFSLTLGNFLENHFWTPPPQTILHMDNTWI